MDEGLGKCAATVSIVVSLFNEEGNIQSLYSQLCHELRRASIDSFQLVLVNDGSTDSSLDICRKLVRSDSRVAIVNLSRNFGHEIAMTAGLDHARGDCVIFMDGDLQHPPSVVPALISGWKDGYQVVVTRRLESKGQRMWKKVVGAIYFRTLNVLSDTYIPPNTPDFRLIDKKYADVIRRMNEQDRMFRGLLHWIGPSNYKVVDFIAQPRHSGVSKYNAVRSLRLAVDGILQFSIRPLRLATYLGIVAVIVSFALGAFVVWDHFAYDKPKTGFATIMATVIFVGSVQLIVLGIIGEYLGRIHLQVKERPLYVAEYITHKGTEDGQEN